MFKNGVPKRIFGPRKAKERTRSENCAMSNFTMHTSPDAITMFKSIFYFAKLKAK